MSVRVSLAAPLGLLPRSNAETALAVGFDDTADLSALGAARVTYVNDQMPAAARLNAAGNVCLPKVPTDTEFTAAFVALPRSKRAARARIAEAMTAAENVVFVDGQKTDGIEATLKDMRKRVEILGVISKGHGKLFWCAPGEAFEDWRAQDTLIDGRWHTVPGVFSAEKIDVGSALLVEHLPKDLSGCFADLGAGWGYLTAHLLDRAPGVKQVHVVEAQGAALDCAKRNVTDGRAVFHWADATTWPEAGGLDGIVMNPPFHTGRAAEPDLGRAFIAVAARLLKPGGQLWMVANRHLPYEATLGSHFSEVREIAVSKGFKLFHATSPVRGRG